MGHTEFTEDSSEPPENKRRFLVCVSPPPPRVPTRKERFVSKLRRFLDFAQSIALAVVVNLIVLALLSLLAVQSGRRDVPVVSVSASPSKNQEKEESSSSSSSPRQKVQKKKTPNEEEPEKTVQEALLARTYSQHSLPSIELASSGEDFSSGAEEFGIGQSMGKGGFGIGVGPGEIGSIFQGKGLGDGSELLLYVDVSRSMRKHSGRVANLVSDYFPRAKIVEVNGCAIRDGEGFVRALESDWSRRRKVFFVCDLLDEVTTTGLEKLRRLLVDNKPSRELHIITYQNLPHLSLKFVVDESWGSVSLVHN